RASCLRSKMLTSGAVTAPAPRAAATTAAIRTVDVRLMRSLRSLMPHARVAPQAVLRRRHVDGRRHRVRDVGMTGHARPDRNLAVAWRDDDGIGEVTGGEGERVVPAVDGFRDVLANRVVRRVAVVTDGDGAMTAAHPARVLLVHDVAVRACDGVVGEVGRTPGVDEGVAADTGKDAGGNPEDHGYTHRHPADTVAEVGLAFQA